MRHTASFFGTIIRNRRLRAPRTRVAPGVLAVALAALAASAGGASAQASINPRSVSVGGGGGGVVVIPDDPMLNPDSPEARAYAALQRERRAIERELRLLKRRNFGSIRVPERRALGLRAMREHTSKPAVMALIEVYDDEKEDVREAVLDHFTTLDPELGIPALAWEAVHDDDAWYRDAARTHLADQLARRGYVPSAIRAEEATGTASGSDQESPGVLPAVRGVIADGLRSTNDQRATAAAELAAALKFYEFIPLIASAQVAQRPVGGGQDRSGDLGWIMIGQQQAYVADLQPVVSNNAVAFDPQIGVVSDGVLLRIHDAVVTAFRTEIHQTLVGMASDAMGHPVNGLGYEPADWRDWYERELHPGERSPEPPQPDEGAPPPTDG